MSSPSEMKKNLQQHRELSNEDPSTSSNWWTQTFNFSTQAINDADWDTTPRYGMSTPTIETTSNSITTSNTFGSSMSKLSNESRFHSITELRTMLWCVDYALCSYNEDFKVPVCYCDSLCFLYGDCCIDYEQNNNMTHHMTHHTTYHDQHADNHQTSTNNSDRYENIQLFQPFMSCYVWCYSIQVLFGYQLVSSCPAGTSVVLNDLCVRNNLDIAMTMIPVVGTNGIHFRNEFCAACHTIPVKTHWELLIDGVKKQLSTFEMKLTKETLFNVFVQQKCVGVVIPPDHEVVRYCIPTSASLQHGGPDVSLYQNNNTFANRDVCSTYRVPVSVPIPKNTNTSFVKFHKWNIFMNSACLQTGYTHSCIKGMDTSILNRHNYDKYSLSTLFKFQQTQNDVMACNENRHKLTFLVRYYFLLFQNHKILIALLF